MGVYCTYFIQGSVDEQETESGLMLPNEPTLQILRQHFPYQGPFHFRLEQRDESTQDIRWLDLIHDEAYLSTRSTTQQLRIKVLPLAHDVDHHHHPMMWKDRPLVLESQSQAYGVWCHDHQNDDPYPQQYHQHHHHRAFSGALLKGGLKGVSKGLTKMWKSAGKYLATPKTSYPSELAQSTLDQVQRTYNTAYDDTNATHQDLLFRLWKALLLQSEVSRDYSTTSRMWQTPMGFRHENPAQDIRGLLTLECLVYFSEVHQAVVRRMLLLPQETRTDHDHGYPFAAVGIHLVLVLVKLIHLDTSEYCNVATPYWKLMEHQMAFHELFCVVFQYFHRTWYAQKASRNEFQHMLEHTKAFTLEVLMKGPTTIEELVMLAHDETPVQLSSSSSSS